MSFQGLQKDCVLGCKCFTGGEIRHHKDCPHYPDSFSKRFDSLDRWSSDLKECVENLLNVAYQRDQGPFEKAVNGLKILVNWTAPKPQPEPVEMEVFKCENCGIAYGKPAEFVELNEKHSSVFYRMSLKYCDPCRRKKQIEALKRLPTVIKALHDNLEDPESKK